MNTTSPSAAQRAVFTADHIRQAFAEAAIIGKQYGRGNAEREAFFAYAYIRGYLGVEEEPCR